MKEEGSNPYESAMSKVRALTRHIKNVQDNAFILGEKLILNGEVDFGKRLIANSFLHDQSKFYSIEWDSIAAPGANDPEKIKEAVVHHNTMNYHHPEHWDGIHNMPRIYLAEMVCDIKSRSEEFGTNLRDWISEDGIKKWGVTKNTKVYKEIMKFVNLLCEKPFKKIK